MANVSQPFTEMARRQGVLSRCPPSLESAAIRTEDNDVLDRNFQETPQNYFYLILLLLLIPRDNVMRHRSVCRDAQQVPVVIVIVIILVNDLSFIFDFKACVLL